MDKKKVLRVSTVSISLDILLKGQLNYLDGFYNVIAVSGFDNHLENVRNRENVDIRNIKIERKISLFKDLLSLYKLVVLFRKEKPLIVHSITPKAGVLCMMAAKLTKVPIRLHTFTGLIFPTQEGFFRKLLIIMDKLLCYCATNVYPEGQGVKNDLIENSITKKELKVLANGNVNGIDIDYFNPDLISSNTKSILKADLKISDDDFVYTFIGRIVKDKGLNELINTFDKLSIKNKKIKLLLVGPIDTDDVLSRSSLLIIETNPSIISVGFQEDVRKYLAISDVFVFPSYREGFPNVVLQAGSMGIPSIVTDINGCNEIIKEGVNGMIIPSRDEEQLFNAMKFLNEEENYRLTLKKKSREMIITRYNNEIVWKAILAEYKRLEHNV